MTMNHGTWSYLTVTLRSGHTGPMTPKTACLTNKPTFHYGKCLGKMFQETPPEILLCTFWWYPLEPEVDLLKRVRPEMKTGNWDRSPFGHCPFTCRYRKINTLGPTGPARIARGKLFGAWLLNLTWLKWARGSVKISENWKNQNMEFVWKYEFWQLN